MKITTSLGVDVIALEQADEVTVMLDLTAPDAPTQAHAGEQVRAEHTAMVVLDRSGSMAGDSLDHAKAALHALADRLDPQDRFGLVTFDDHADVAVPAGTVGDLGRSAIHTAIARIESGGMTDLSSGYLRGLQEARRVATGTGATLIVLSDGLANVGPTEPGGFESLARAAAAEHHLTTSTIGIGDGYDELLLAALATGGSGNHVFAPHGDAAAAALTGEIEGLLSKTVQAASVLITPGPHVANIRVLNPLPTNPVVGGVMAELGDFWAGETRRLLVSIEVPAMVTLGVAEVATLTFTWVELPALVQHTLTMPVAVNVVPGDEAAGRVASPEVTRERLLLEAQEAKRISEEALRRGDLSAAGAILGAAFEAVASAPPSLVDQRILAETRWLGQARGDLANESREVNLKRLRADRTRKARGYQDRPDGQNT